MVEVLEEILKIRVIIKQLVFFSTGIQNRVVTSVISIEFLVYLNRERKAKANKAVCSLQIRNRSESGTQLYRSSVAGAEKQ